MNVQLGTQPVEQLPQHFFSDLGGTHSMHGGAGVDSLIFDDSLGTVQYEWLLTPGAMVRTPGNGGEVNVLSFEGMDTVTVETGRAADLVVVNGTAAGTNIRVRGGGGGGQAATAADTIHFEETDVDGFATLLPTFGPAPGVSVNSDGSGQANVHIVESQTLAGLTIWGGGRVSLEAGNFITLRTPSLSILGSGVLDVTDNDLILDYSGATPIGTAAVGVYSGFSSLIQRGHNGGSWNGTGGIITSMPDAADGLTTVAIAEASEVLGISPGENGEFNGFTVDGTTLLIKYTYAGDANLDGVISGDDYSVVDFNAGVPNASGYLNGDFNYDGMISGDDYSLIDFNIAAQGMSL